MGKRRKALAESHTHVHKRRRKGTALNRLGEVPPILGTNRLGFIRVITRTRVRLDHRHTMNVLFSKHIGNIRVVIMPLVNSTLKAVLQRAVIADKEVCFIEVFDDETRSACSFQVDDELLENWVAE